MAGESPALRTEDMSEKVYLDGELVEADEARLTVFDTALQHGVGLFEILRSYSGKIFRLGEHIERLKRSASELGLVVDADAGEFGRAVDELLAANGLTDARVRITVTGGSARVGIHRGLRGNPSTLITAGPSQAPPGELYNDGVTVLLSDHRVSPSDPIARYKTVSYLPRLVALRAAQQAQLADAIWFTTDGYLAGGSVSNVFLIKDDVVLTPSLDLPIVPGIARKVVIEVAKDLQIPVGEGKFSMQDVLSAEECFLTNTAVEVLPVVAIERHLVGSGKVGSLTRTLLQRYRRQVREELILT